MTSINPMMFRLELFPPKASDLLDANTLKFLTLHPTIKMVNIPHKSKDQNLLSTVKQLATAHPSLDICLHYSIKYAYGGSADKAFNNLLQTCKSLATLLPSSSSSSPDRRCSLLLVSGGKPKRKFDTIAALSQLAQLSINEPTSLPFLSSIPFYVAFNPYESSPASPSSSEEEQCRLQAKLAAVKASPLLNIAGIYLQAGDDTDKLRSGLQFIQDTIITKYPDMKLYGSVFIPARKFLAQMKFRPWGGVYLSDGYLNSVDEACMLTRRVLEVYKEFNVVPLVETDLANSNSSSDGDVNSRAASILGVEF